MILHAQNQSAQTSARSDVCACSQCHASYTLTRCVFARNNYCYFIVFDRERATCRLDSCPPFPSWRTTSVSPPRLTRILAEKMPSPSSTPGHAMPWSHCTYGKSDLLLGHGTDKRKERYKCGVKCVFMYLVPAMVT
jgi:hypothetical protein